VFSLRRSILAGALLTTLVAGCASVTVSPITPPPATPVAPANPSTAGSAPAASAGLPSFAHVYVIVLENEAYGSLVGSPKAPYLNGLIAGYGLATSYDGVAHPSQPNYLALFSGSTQGVTDDSLHNIAAANLADQLDAHGKTWRVYAQDYPGGCFTGATSSGTVDATGSPGTYARKHNPAISFTDIATNPSRCAQISDLSTFDPSAASFELIVPNECNDMHSCPVSTGDAFLRSFVPRITSSPAFAGSVLFITTDEGTTNTGGGGQVATIVASPMVHAGFTSPAPYDHYSLLRTIEDSWGLGCLGQACAATDMAAFFR
jgi:phosphatidylinositol-3-phosphatase